MSSFIFHSIFNLFRIFQITKQRTNELTNEMPNERPTCGGGSMPGAELVVEGHAEGPRPDAGDVEDRLPRVLLPARCPHLGCWGKGRAWNGAIWTVMVLAKSEFCFTLAHPLMVFKEREYIIFCRGVNFGGGEYCRGEGALPRDPCHGTPDTAGKTAAPTIEGGRDPWWVAVGAE